jgi:hypothetical protein
MAQHVKILGILHIILGGLGILGGVIALLVMGGVAGLVGVTDHSSDSAVAIPVLAAIGGVVFILLLVLSLPGVIGGFGLLQFKPWARILVIVLSAFDLLGFPFHTALGIYGFWVLLSKDTERLFQLPLPSVPAVPRV